jgi:hypothetical protein
VTRGRRQPHQDSQFADGFGAEEKGGRGGRCLAAQV